MTILKIIWRVPEIPRPQKALFGVSAGSGETNAKLFFLMVMIINLAVRCLPYEKGENWIGEKGNNFFFSISFTPSKLFQGRQGLTTQGSVSMGAMGASAPIVFKSVGASTHEFWQFSIISIIFHKIWLKDVMNLVIQWQKEMSSTHSLEFLTGPLQNVTIWKFLSR